jgi:hypothetical protein
MNVKSFTAKVRISEPKPKASPPRTAPRVDLHTSSHLIAAECSLHVALCAFLCGLGSGVEFIISTFAVKLFFDEAIA